MLGDQQRDKDLARNQVIAILLTTVLFIGWLYFFGPKPPAVTDPGTDTTAARQGLPPGTRGDAENAPVAVDSPVDVADAGTASPGPAVIPDALAFDPAVAPAREFLLSNGQLDLVFTDVGARLKQGTVRTKYGEDQQLVPSWGETPEDEAVYPLSLAIDGDPAVNVNALRWTPEEVGDGQTLRFHLELPAPVATRITKTFRLSADHPNVLELDVTYTNTGADTRRLGLDDKEPAFSVFWAPNVNSGDANNSMVKQEVVWREAAENTHLATAKLPGFVEGRDFHKRAIDPEWVAIKSAYFIVAMKPEFEGATGLVDGEPKHFLLSLTAPRMEVAAGASETRAFKVYLGPLQGESLAQAWPSLKTSLEFFTMFGFMDTFAKGMLFVLNWFYGSVYANYGFAIIFLTILVRSAMFPLTLKGMKSMKKMQKLAPEMEKIKAEVGEDQQAMQKRMMELYRERGVNPLGGCMPLLLQTPVFIALYRVYATAYEFRGAPFISWVDDLSEPDALLSLPFSIPMPFTANGIDSFNLLPILMGLAMVASTKLMPTSGPVQNPQQKMIMTLMPIFFSAICYNMAAGLNLYILTSTLLGIAQNYFVHVSDEEVKSKPGKAKVQKMKRRGRHFYLAAQDKKREMAREERREKKKKGRGGKQTGGPGSDQK